MAVITLSFYDPSDGSFLGTLDDSEVKDIQLRPALFELGAGMFTVSRHLAEASAAMLQKGVICIPTIPVIDADPFWGFVLRDELAVLISRAEQSGEDLTITGPGIMSILGNARLDEEVFAPAPPASDERGSSDQTGQWFWYAQPYGAIYTRAIEEGQNQPGTPLGLVTIDFDREEDSDGVDWDTMAFGYQVPTGTSVLELGDRLAQTGEFYPVMVPVITGGDLTLALSVYQSIGSNLSASVQFRKGVNILTELQRRTVYTRVTHLITKDLDGVWDRHVTANAYDQATYAYLDVQETNDPDTVAKIATTALNASESENEEFVLEIVPDLLPFRDFNLGDLIRLHTGSGAHDLNETNQRVIACRIILDEASVDTSTATREKSLSIVPELSYREVRGMAGTNTQVGTPGHCCGPMPPFTGAPAVDATQDGAWNFSSDNSPGGARQYDDSSTYPVRARVPSSGVVNANALNTTIGHTSDPNSASLSPRPSASAGTTYHFHFRFRNKGGIGAGPQTMHGGFLNSSGTWIGGFQSSVLATTPNDEDWHEYSVDLVAPSGTATVGWNVESAAAAVDFMVITHGGSAAVPPSPLIAPPSPSGSGQWGTSDRFVPIDTVYPVPSADTIPVSDDADYYTGVDVETILQELGERVAEVFAHSVQAARMQLTTVVAGEPVPVWDADDSLIPTLIPLD